jgi:hypothetical protein
MCGGVYSWACSAVEAEDKKEIRISFAGMNNETRNHLKRSEKTAEMLEELTEKINTGTKELKSAHDDLDYWTAIANKTEWDQQVDLKWNRGPINLILVLLKQLGINVNWEFLKQLGIRDHEEWDNLVSNNAKKRERVQSKVAKIELFLGNVAEAAHLLKCICSDTNSKNMDAEDVKKLEALFEKIKSSDCSLSLSCDDSRPTRWHRYWMNYAFIGCITFVCGKKLVEMHRSKELEPLLERVKDMVKSSIEENVLKPFKEILERLGVASKRIEIVSEEALKDSNQLLEKIVKNWHKKKSHEDVSVPVALKALKDSFEGQIAKVLIYCRFYFI